MDMITKDIIVNDTKYKVTLTDQVLSQADNLKSLYASMADADPENFEQLSSQTSSVINEIATAVEPEVSDGHLDGCLLYTSDAADE